MRASRVRAVAADREPTSYGPDLTASYERMFRVDSPVSWLVMALEDFAIHMLPEKRDIAVLDIPCGIGSYCRRAARLGYSQVFGSDISESQIETCVKHESETPLGVRYYKADVRHLFENPEFEDKFDVVNASWLYDLAVDENDLLKMMKCVNWCLRSGGFHSGIDLNFAIRGSSPLEWTKYGISLMDDKIPGYRPRDGEMITGKVAMRADDEVYTDVNESRSEKYAKRPGVELAVIYYTEETYRRNFAKSNFTDLRFYPPTDWTGKVSSLLEGERQLFHEYSTCNPEMIGFTALKE
jgi:SAM-dependent methyltransferase